jgi:hypothetical protein
MNIENFDFHVNFSMQGTPHLSSIFGGVLGAIWHTVFSRQQQQ